MPDFINYIIMAMAIILSGFAYYSYFKDFLVSSIAPNRYSWLIWTVAALLEATTFHALSDDLVKSVGFIFSVLFCVAICVLVWGRSSKKMPPLIDIITLFITVVGFAIWGLTKSPLIAHLVSVAIIPISFIPTWNSALANPFNEKSRAWALWSLSDLMILFVIVSRLNSGAELPFILAELTCHAVTYLMVSRFRFKWEARKLGETKYLKMGHSHLGLAVFAKRNFKKGERITRFIGDIISKSELPEDYSGREDQFVQIGQNEFMGPSGRVDDYINHSCDPNSGLVFSDEDIILVAIRDIKIGEEINWDYSTTMSGLDWSMHCECRSENCRKKVAGFETIPQEQVRKYADLGILPEYVAKSIKANSL